MMKLLLIILLILQYVLGQQMPKKPAAMPVPSDIPFIVCEVCQKAAKTLYKSVKQKRQDKAPVKLSEEDVLSIVEKSCDPDNKYGEWITKLDITESKDTLKLVEHLKSGRCQEECKTIQRACEDAIGDVDTDIGEILWRNTLKLSTFINDACFKISNKCSKKTKKYKKGSRKDHKFFEMSDKEVEANKMMQNMKGMPGMPGMEMYSREDMEAMREQVGSESASDSKDDEMIMEGGSQKLGFFETFKQIVFDIYSKVKGVGLDFYSTFRKYFGYARKREL